MCFEEKKFRMLRQQITRDLNRVWSVQENLKLEVKFMLRPGRRAEASQAEIREAREECTCTRRWEMEKHRQIWVLVKVQLKKK